MHCRPSSCDDNKSRASPVPKDATPASDYDLVGIRDAGDAVRDARLVDGVYPEIKPRNADAINVVACAVLLVLGVLWRVVRRYDFSLRRLRSVEVAANRI
ncbi:MAG TPA: hypothetical protein VMJ10_23520 [Kofleriaceae bacterium]|nr:hypothetical protein [Kofleriaceae bacterium]